MTTLKRKVISYLVIAAVVMLVANIAIDLLSKKNSKPAARELNRAEIESTIWKVLDDYGINANWVVKKKFRSNEEDSINSQFIVSIPSDVPTPLIIKDIKNIVEEDITGFVAEEQKIYGATEIKVFSNEYLKLKLLLVPDSNLKRKPNELAFIIKDGLELSDADYGKFLTTLYPLSAQLVPDPDMITPADSLSNYSKEYVILLNNEISDSKMKLVPEYSKEILRSSVKNILIGFRKSPFIMYDENSLLFTSPIFNFVRDEFRKRRVRLIPFKRLINLDLVDEPEMLSRFNFYAQDTTGSRPKIFNVSFEGFQKLIPALERYERKGSRVIPVSKMNLPE